MPSPTATPRKAPPPAGSGRYAPRRAATGYLDGLPWTWRSPNYQALGHTFAIRAMDADLGAWLESLFLPFEASCAPATVYSLLDRGAGSRLRYATYAGNDRLTLNPRPDRLVHTLLWHVNGQVFDRSDTYVVVHAAVAALGDAAVLLPAPMEHGKTTTVAGLVRAGYGYLSDEVAAISPATLSVHPFHRALSINLGAWELFADLEPLLPQTVAAYQPRGTWHLPATAIRPDALAGPATPRLIVSPRYAPGEPTRLEPLRRAEALLLLASNTHGLHGRPGHHLDVLARVLAGCDCYRLISSDLDKSCELITDALERTQAS